MAADILSHKAQGIKLSLVAEGVHFTLLGAMFIPIELKADTFWANERSN